MHFCLGLILISVLQSGYLLSIFSESYKHSLFKIELIILHTHILASPWLPHSFTGTPCAQPQGWKSQPGLGLCCLLFLHTQSVSSYHSVLNKSPWNTLFIPSHSPVLLLHSSFFSHHFCCCLILSFQSTSLVMSHYYLFQGTAPKVLFIQLPPITVDRESI